MKEKLRNYVHEKLEGKLSFLEKFYVTAAVTRKLAVSWGVTPCILILFTDISE
jgi:hypothetical protein